MSAVVNFDAIKATAEAALEIAKTITVTDADSAATATAKRAELKIIADRVESIRKDLVKPIDDAKAKIQADAKAISDPIKAARADIESKIILWQEEEKAKAKAIADAEKAAAEARLAATMADDNATIEEVEQASAQVEIAAKPVKMSGAYKPLKTRENWKFHVTDLKALVKYALENDALWMISANEVEIGKRVRAAEKPLRECPGLEIYSEVGVG